MDERNKKLAKNLLNYSCRLQKGEKILIECKGYSGYPLVKEIIKEVYKIGGIPFVYLTDEIITRELLLGGTAEQYDSMASWDSARMNEMKAYIYVNAPLNASEYADVPTKKQAIYSKHYSKPVIDDICITKTKWVVVRYPTPNMAQSASMSNEAFENYYYDVCMLDYNKMSSAMDSIVQLMQKTDRVHIIGEGTDLTFSIKDIDAVKCAGQFNIPDGEIFTAPIKDSVNGYVTFNTPAVYQGFTYENIRLEFENGKIIKATANDTKRINEVLDTDEGARYIGEFALGVNPYITKPMKDTLFDEKIRGSFHFTPGKAYDEADNGNVSAIHWDLVCIQTADYGGGKIYFDDVLIREDGYFVLDELKCLNPENLI